MRIHQSNKINGAHSSCEEPATRAPRESQGSGQSKCLPMEFLT